MEKLNSLNSL